jgi:flavin reductase (DIM6/NTAB) family NADH-FMN oxidoreductase RutF
VPIVDASELPGRRAYRLLVDCVVPRPIAWVSTVSADGRANLAPFSFFQAVGAEPPAVLISIGKHRDGAYKDTLLNLRDTGTCAISVVVDELAEAMNVTAGEYPFGVDELARAGLTTAPCRHVAAPRVAESPVALECRLMQEVAIGPETGENAYVVAVLEVLAFHVDDALYDDGRIDPRRLRPLGRLGGSAYSHPGEVFELERPPSERPATT